MRSFIAIELPEAVRSALSRIEEELKKSKADVRWIKPENIHLTLKFLGDVEENNTNKITGKMKDICSRYNPFALEIRGIGVFPNLRSPRVLWAGMEESDALINLQKEIEDAMALLGFQREDRKFTAHLTLGRFRSLAGKEKITDAVSLHEKDTFGSVNAGAIFLMRSDLHPEGARYSRIAEVPLGA